MGSLERAFAHQGDANPILRAANITRRARGVIVAAGVAYFVIGFTFALPATHVKAWRLAAWIASGLVYAAHIGHEHFRSGSSPRALASHVAVSVAIGGFLFAVAGAVHSLLTTSTIRPAWFVALVAWPAGTAIPAFVVALVVSAILRRLARGPQ